MTAPNIFIPRNNWNVKAFQCRKPIPFDCFEKKVARIVKDETGINPLGFRHYRGREVVQSRQIFLVMMERYTKRSYASIAGIVDKDHATINSSKKAVSDMYDTDKDYHAMIDRIDSQVKNL